MSLGEFELIRRFFSATGARRDDVTLGVGDDAALLRVPPGSELVAAVDTLVAGVHFPANSPAESIGHRSLAVNLSDFAAMGATPAWCTLALTLPQAQAAWLERFSRALHELATRHDVALVGGDTTSGPLASTVQLLGFLPQGSAVLRSGARPGDLVCVSGTVGDAAAGLALLQGRLAVASETDRHALENRFLFPEPRVELGRQLRGRASAAIDVSDGLLADLAKLLDSSKVGARIELDQLPLSESLAAGVPGEHARRFALGGGDDYELCFTIAPAGFEALAGLDAGVPVHRIGVVQRETGLQCFAGGEAVDVGLRGFDHFRA